jgi:hypothetical protein
MADPITTVCKRQTLSSLAALMSLKADHTIRLRMADRALHTDGHRGQVGRRVRGAREGGGQ